MAGFLDLAKRNYVLSRHCDIHCHLLEITLKYSCRKNSEQYKGLSKVLKPQTNHRNYVISLSTPKLWPKPEIFLNQGFYRMHFPTKDDCNGKSLSTYTYQLNFWTTIEKVLTTANLYPFWKVLLKKAPVQKLMIILIWPFHSMKKCSYNAANPAIPAIFLQALHKRKEAKHIRFVSYIHSINKFIYLFVCLFVWKWIIYFNCVN